MESKYSLGESIIGAGNILWFLIVVIHGVGAGILVWLIDPYEVFVGFLIFIGIFIWGIFAGWTSTLVLRGFGELVRNTSRSAYASELVLKEVTEIRKEMKKGAAASYATASTATASSSNTQTLSGSQSASTANTQYVNRTEMRASQGEGASSSGSTEAAKSSEKKEFKQEVHFENRENGYVICPNCSQRQKSNRNVCYMCGAKFVFDEE